MNILSLLLGIITDFSFFFQSDDYPINEKVALQLAGLQAQVSLGDPQPGKTEFYADVHSYLPQRIAQAQKAAEWVSSGVEIRAEWPATSKCLIFIKTLSLNYIYESQYYIFWVFSIVNSTNFFFRYQF